MPTKRQETLLLGGLLLPGWCILLPGHGVGLHTKGLPWGTTVHNMTTPHFNIPILGESKEGPGTNQRTQFCMKKSVGWLGLLGWDTGLPWGNETCPHRHHTGYMEKSGTPGWRGEKLHVQNYAHP